MLLTNALGAAIEGLDQALHVIAAHRRYLGEAGGGQILETIAKGHQAGLVATHEVGHGSAGTHQGGNDAQGDPEQRAPRSGTAKEDRSQDQHRHQGAQADGEEEAPYHCAFKCCAIHPSGHIRMTSLGNNATAGA